MAMDDVCYCGHVEDEHEETLLAPCAVEDCDCVAFEPNHDEESER